MSDRVTLEFLGATLRAIQAEQRTQRMENDLIRKEIGRLGSRDELLEVLRVLADRVSNFEAVIEARLDQLSQTTEARLDRLSQQTEARFDQLSQQVAKLAPR